jgi:outer membrane protein assembly factor BamE
VIQLQEIFQSSRYVTAITILCAVLLVSCSIYRPEIYQGQSSDLADVSKLTVGMTPDEVLGIMGTPLIVDSFHRDRWDYVHNVIDSKRTVVSKQKVTVFFKDGVVAKVEHNLDQSSESEMQKVTE